MIYATGDTHGQIDFAKLKIFAEEYPELTRNDYVIIVGLLRIGGDRNAKEFF